MPTMPQEERTKKIHGWHKAVRLCQIHEKYFFTKIKIGRLRDCSIEGRMQRHHSEEASPEVERSWQFHSSMHHWRTLHR